jgi:gamma-glutamyl:cysteine ligase YbdK (ATP-grasp superfamily)
VERGALAWSNELVNHVVELKVAEPVASLEGLGAAFHGEVTFINDALEAHGAMLLPTGAHPFMDPLTETQLWPHEYSEVYRLYDRIFGCRGHGWSNLQSTHLNLSFATDDEFGRLHAAVRLLLPILPALSASTPYLDGRATGFADARLEKYRHNQDRIPSVAGVVIPEGVFTRADYEARIFAPIRRDVGPYDTDGVLDHHFLNSRGAIARFDRGALEIRVLDLQECPAADMAVVQGTVAVLRALVGGRFAPLAEQQAWDEADLAALFIRVVKNAERAVVDNAAYLRLFGLDRAEATAAELWSHLLGRVEDLLPAEAAATLRWIVEHGTLATRLMQTLGENPTREALRRVYAELACGLAGNALYEPEPSARA